MKLLQLLESINNYNVNLLLIIRNDYNISDIVNELRAKLGVTIVKVIDLPQLHNVNANTSKYDYVYVSIKFITIQEPLEYLENLKNSCIKSESRIEGLISIQIKEKTLK